MLLRSTLEKILPAAEDESRLSTDAKSLVYRGVYARSTGISRVYMRTYSTGPPPCLVIVTRDNPDKTKRETGNRRVYWHDEDIVPGFDEMRAPRALARANRIEGIARKIKGTVFALAVAAAGTSFGLYVASTVEKAPLALHPAEESCAQVVEPGETLVPLSNDQKTSAKNLGETVCRIDDLNYLAISSSN